MTYRVVKNQQEIATASRITFDHGILECRSDFGGRVDAYYAPGSWDMAYWEEEES